VIENKRARIKIGIRRLLSSNPSRQYVLTREELPVENKMLVVSLDEASSAIGHLIQCDEYDDLGDYTTAEENNEIYEAIKAIVDEHNQSLT
jgi:peptidyl-tRNA hydrolase